MKLDFAERRVLVTGGTRGIGYAIVDMLSGFGADVVAVGTDAVALAKLERLDGVRVVALDLSDGVGLERGLNQLPGPFDVLVNNAGINRHAFVGELDLDEFDRIMQVNLRSAVAICRFFVPEMARRGYGRIVNMTSIFSEVSKAGRACYATSKFALYGFTRTLALDYAAQGVLANSVAPGFIATEMTERMLGESGIREMTAQVPLGRLGTPSEVARIVAFLASSANTFITGQNVVIDGGFTST